MKNGITLLIIVCSFSIQLFSQKKEFRLGMSAAVNYSNAYINGFGDLNPGLGYLISTDISFSINKNFFIQTGLGYEINRFSLRYTDRINNEYEHQYRLSNINLPLMVRFTTNGKIRFFANVGAQIQNAYKPKFTITDNSNGEVTESYSILYKTGLGAILGLGISSPIGKNYFSKIETRAYQQINSLYGDKRSIAGRAYSVAIVLSFSRRIIKGEE
ncbi:MAG: hypothetical protein CL840_20960 [Crocinitomicaceae bacterium]|nr:hypothetical protein [Crocinitomicaceae bacterium]|tara:strand:+ start:9874 stop:10518 length:645 start_codon:yes stop_codon:yes gene_type:complete